MVGRVDGLSNNDEVHGRCRCSAKAEASTSTLFNNLEDSTIQSLTAINPVEDPALSKQFAPYPQRNHTTCSLSHQHRTPDNTRMKTKAETLTAITTIWTILFHPAITHSTKEVRLSYLRHYQYGWHCTGLNRGVSSCGRLRGALESQHVQHIPIIYRTKGIHQNCHTEPRTSMRISFDSRYTFSAKN